MQLTFADLSGPHGSSSFHQALAREGDQAGTAPLAWAQTGWEHRRPLKKQAEGGENLRHFYDTKRETGNIKTTEEQHVLADKKTRCLCTCVYPLG